MAGNLISSLSLFTVKSVPSIYAAWWLNIRVNGSNAIISSGNHECFKNKTQWSDCGAESWCRKKVPPSIFTSFSRQTGTWANCHVPHCLFAGGMNLMENHTLHWTSTKGVIASGTIGGPWSHIFGQFQVLRWAPTLINYTWKEPCTHPAPACTVMGRFLLSGWWGGKWDGLPFFAC